LEGVFGARLPDYAESFQIIRLPLVAIPGTFSVEKLLKALYVKHKKTHAIFGHDLLRLAPGIGIVITEEQEDWLDRLTTFNINARYDNYKQKFYKLCTKEFAEEWKSKIETLREWLLKQQ